MTEMLSPTSKDGKQSKTGKLVYLSVVEDDAQAVGEGQERGMLGARYTHTLLRSTLQLMGCKPRTAHHVTQAVFEALEGALSEPGLGDPASPRGNPLGGGGRPQGLQLQRSQFRDAVEQQLQKQLADRPLMEDFDVACSIREQRRSVVVLLCGTSGTGKSTLASLLASRLGITTCLSTDSVRHMLRSFASEADNKLLWVSTYQAGEYVGVGSGGKDAEDKGKGPAAAPGGGRTEAKRAIEGYKAQSEMVIESLDRLITSCEARRESMVVEGVHLSLGFVVALMQQHPTVVPFLVHISNENKHRERFAVRAKYMTLEPGANRYVKYIRNIRAIQDYLVRRADKHCVPKVDNTNVDRSVAAIHATVLGCLRRMARGEALLEPGSRQCKVVLAEFTECAGATWRGKDMLQIIRQKHPPRAGGPGPSTPSDMPSTSSTPTGPLSDDDHVSFYDPDSDAGSSDLPTGPGSGTESDSDDDPPLLENASPSGRLEMGSVADSDEEDDFLEV